MQTPCSLFPLHPLLTSGALPLPFPLLSTEADQDSIRAGGRMGLCHLPLLDLVDPKSFSWFRILNITSMRLHAQELRWVAQDTAVVTSTVGHKAQGTFQGEV